MDTAEMIAALSSPTAYPYHVESVDVRQTHISMVFLAGAIVYKVKKPVKLAFLDFSTLETRRHFCEEEIRLNRRLAPHVYLGVVPIVRVAGGLQFERPGEVVEWAVKMQRLPDAATLQERLKRGEVDGPLVENLARRIAAFHREAETNERIASFGRFDGVAKIILDIFQQAASQVGTAVNQTVFARVKDLAEATLARNRPLIDQRAVRQVPRDCHGDLHLDHVYILPEKKPPEDLTIIDCIEFNKRFRYIDPVADMAFPTMDFAFHGRRDLAEVFARSYFLAAGDEEGRALLPMYTGYRATVRGTLEGMLLEETEVPLAERIAAQGRARAHWMLALCELESPGRKPCVLLVAGLPGTGKSTLARGLAEAAGFTVVRSDVVRKELAGLSANEPAPAHRREALYSAASTYRTYTECLSTAERLLAEGKRVLVDATFREEQQRLSFIEMSIRSGVPSILIVCQATPETIRNRLEARRGDASDADWSVYLKVAENWEPASQVAARDVHAISTDGTPAQVVAEAAKVRRRSGLQ